MFFLLLYILLWVLGGCVGWGGVLMVGGGGGGVKANYNGKLTQTHNSYTEFLQTYLVVLALFQVHVGKLHIVN